MLCATSLPPCPMAQGGQAQGGQAHTIGYTGWYTCHPLGHTAYQTCTPGPQGGGVGAMAQGGQPQTIGPTGWFTCGQPHHTHQFVCFPGGQTGAVTHFDCQAQGGGAAPMAQGGGAPVHTMFGCVVSAPPHCPTVHPTCVATHWPCGQGGNTTATLCTQAPSCPDGGGAGAMAQGSGAGGQAAGGPLLSVPPHCPTVAPMCAVTHWQCGPQQVQTTPATVCTAYAGCQHQGGGGQASAGTPVSVPPHCPTVHPVCAVTHWQCGPQQVQTLATVCTAYAGCHHQGGGAGAVAQGGAGQQGMAGTPVSVPPHCPTVHPMCAVTHWQCGPQQAHTTPATICTAYAGCQHQGGGSGQALAGTPVSVPPHCPTVAPMCPVTHWQCGPQQYQSMPITACGTNVGGQPQGGGVGAMAQGGTGQPGMAGTPVSVPPHCPTVHPTCAVTQWQCGPQQGQAVQQGNPQQTLFSICTPVCG